MKRGYLCLLFFFACVWWRGEGVVGNIPGLSSTCQVEEWTLEKKKLTRLFSVGQIPG